MTIEQIKFFLAVDKLNSFSIAADELCISQSSLSKQIKSLETELGISLFERNTRNLKLTSAGKDFKKSAEKIIKEYNLMINNINSHSLLEKQTVRVATIPVMTQYKITSLIASFQQKYPNIKVEIDELEHGSILNLFDKSLINLAFIRTEHLSKNVFDITPLFDDELVLVTSKKHRLANKKYISLSDLSDENFIFLGHDSGVYKSCIESCNNAGFSPKISYSNSRLETIIGLVADGLGVTLLMNRVISYFNHPDISIILLKDPIESTLGLVNPTNAKLSENEKLFKNFAISYLNKKNPKI